MVKKKVAKTTIEGLALMVAKGFEESNIKVDGLKSEINKRFDKVESRLDRVESLLTTDYKRRVA